MLPLLTSPDQGGAGSGASGNPLQALAGYEGHLKLAAKEIRLPSRLVVRDSAASWSWPREVPGNTAAGRFAGGGDLGELAAGSLAAPELRSRRNSWPPTWRGRRCRSRLWRDGRWPARRHACRGPDPDHAGTQPPAVGGRGDDLVMPQAKLGSLHVTALLEQGHLRLDPLQAKLPQGRCRPRDGRAVRRDFTADLDLMPLGSTLRRPPRGWCGRSPGWPSHRHAAWHPAFRHPDP